MLTLSNDRKNLLWAVASGLLLTGSFPKFGTSFLAWISLVPLLFAIRGLSMKGCFRLGMVTGFVHYLTLMYWLTIAMQTYGGMTWYASIVLLFLLAAYLALYVAAYAALVGALSPTPLLFLASAPSLWVALEFIRAKALTGFPWELLGYSQYKTLPVIQISDIFGVYGVSFLVAAVNACLLLLFLYALKGAWRHRQITWRHATSAVLALVLPVGLTLSYGAWRLLSIRQEIDVAPKVRTAVVQGNITQDKKWDAAFRNATIKTYLQLSRSAALESPDVIVWPETATPFYFLWNEALSYPVQADIRAANTHFIIGSPSVEQTEDGARYYNSAYLMSPDGVPLDKYNKAHLVPFGEYVPLNKLLPFVEKMVTGIGDFSPGLSGFTTPWPHGRIGVQICYEIIFPSLSRQAVKNHADLLVNITNDAWYGKSSAPYQHFSMAVLRAVENRRSVIRAANTGISGFVDPAGRIVAKTSLFEEAALSRSMPVMKRKTCYTRWGDWFPLCCGIWLVLLFIKNHVIIRPNLRKSEKEK